MDTTETARGVRMMRPIEGDDDLFTWEKFAQSARDGYFIDYDGFGELATATQKSEIAISPSEVDAVVRPAWATHVVWYNR
jgi:hypothetical protein